MLSFSPGTQRTVDHFFFLTVKCVSKISKYSVVSNGSYLKISQRWSNCDIMPVLGWLSMELRNLHHTKTGFGEFSPC